MCHFGNNWTVSYRFVILLPTLTELFTKGHHGCQTDRHTHAHSPPHTHTPRQTYTHRHRQNVRRRWETDPTPILYVMKSLYTDGIPWSFVRCPRLFPTLSVAIFYCDAKPLVIDAEWANGRHDRFDHWRFGFIRSCSFIMLNMTQIG